MTTPCETFDAVYENLPMVDTIFCDKGTDSARGLTIETEGGSFTTERVAEGVLRVDFGKDSVTFYEDRIQVNAKALCLFAGSLAAELTAQEHSLTFRYRGTAYRLRVEGGSVSLTKDGNARIRATQGTITLYPECLSSIP